MTDIFKLTFKDHDPISIVRGSNETFWIKANDIARILGYERPRKAIYDHIDKKCKTTFRDLKVDNPNLNLKQTHPSTVFIEEPAIGDFLNTCVKGNNEFREWFFKEFQNLKSEHVGRNVENHRHDDDDLWSMTVSESDSEPEDVGNESTDTSVHVGRLETENKVFRQMIDKTQLQQVFCVLENRDNGKTEHKRKYKFVDTQKRYFTKAFDDSEEYDLCFNIEYIIIDGEGMTKKVLKEISEENVKYHYDDKSKCITIYDDDFDLINCVKKSLREVMLW